MFSFFAFTLRSFIHFELVFVDSVRQGSHVILWWVAIQFPLLGDARSAGEPCSRMKPAGSPGSHWLWPWHRTEWIDE